jgi:outer membrane protein assembly factor BamC
VQANKPGFFARMFGAESKQPTPQRYRILVKSENDATTVSVLDAQGQPDASQNAQRIVQLLAADLN